MLECAGATESFDVIASQGQAESNNHIMVVNQFNITRID